MKCSALLCVAIAGVMALAGADWPNWRGPEQTGVATGDKFPTTWGPEKNMAWKVSLPGRGSSTPAVLGDRVFVTSATDEQNLALAFNPQGELQWKTAVGEARLGKHRKATGANPSPVTDGSHVYVYFKSGDLACLTLDGKLVWEVNLQDRFAQDTLWWDLGTSPVLTNDYVVVAVLQSGPSFLVAFDKTTGKLAWKHDRMLDAPEEANQSYSTPVVYEHAGEQRLLVLGADHVTAHKAATGDEIWRVGGLNPEQNKFFRSISSPVVADGYAVVPYARGSTLTAIKLGGKGDVTKSHIAWQRKGVSADVPTPAVQDGKIYVLGDKGPVTCLELASGETVWQTDLPRNRNAYSASPIIAAGHLYLTREDGATVVLPTSGDADKIVENELNDPSVSTPVPVNGRIYLRSFETLYCVE